MKKGLTLLALASVIAGCGQQQDEAAKETNETEAMATPKVVETAVATGIDKAALAEEAKGAVKSLGGQLKQQLQAAIKDSGPVGAVDVCKDIAPQLSRNVSQEKGLDIKRVSLKNRNPFLGVPNEWQVEVLNDFEARKQAGEDPAGLSYAKVVGKEFRFMKAVPTAAVCLNCHGSEIKPEVAAQINRYYPDDKAIGYKEGDIRGAFVVTKLLAD